jgi:hypothetical protein
MPDQNTNSATPVVEATTATKRPLPSYGLPLFRLIGVGAAGAVMMGSLGYLIALAMKRPGGGWAALLGLMLVIGVYSGVIVSLRPWIVRRSDRWPILLFGAQGGVLFGVLFGGLLLYSATRPDAVVFGLVVAAGFTAAVLGMAIVYGQVARVHEAPPSA